MLILAVGCALAQPAGVHQVYVMPMAGGLDQYLAEWLTRMHVMQVVVDPKAADAVLTDRIGEAFEQKLNQIRPPDVAGKATSKGATDKDAKKDDTAGAGGAPHAFQSSVVHGTVFLVDAKSRQVLWSDYEKPERSSDSNLNREAERIAKKLQANQAQ